MFCEHCKEPWREGRKTCIKCGEPPVNKPADKAPVKQQGQQWPAPHRISEEAQGLVDHLRKIIKCEYSLIGYEDTIERNREAMGRLCIQEPPRKPVWPLKKSPPPMSNGRMLKGIIAAFVLIVSFFVNHSDAILLRTIGIPFLLWQMWSIYAPTRKMQKAYRREVESYNKEWTVYKIDKDRYDARLRRETAEKRIYKEQSSRIEERIVEVKKTLSILYEFNVVHENYRYLQAVASFRTYLDEGLTSTLVQVGSDEGAYNKYKKDMHVEKLIGAMGMNAREIVAAVNTASAAMRAYNRVLCDAIDRSSEMRRADVAEITAGINSLNQKAEADRLARKISATHLKEIAEFQKIQTEALCDYDRIAGRQVR